MFSRTTAAVLAGALALLAACGPKHLPNASGLDLGGSDAGCLSRASRQVADYLAGRADEQETSRIFDCASHSLKLFRDRTRGSNADYYLPQELRAFLERYFLSSGTQISDALLGETMELKRVFAGGSGSQLTVADLNRVLDIFERIRGIALELRPYMPLSPAAYAKRPEADADAAALALSRAADELGTIFEDTGACYTFAHFKAMVHELQLFMAPDTPPILSILSDHMDVIPVAKRALEGDAGPEGDIGAAQWRLTFSLAADWYGLAVRLYSFQQHNDDWVLGSGRERMVPLVREAFLLLDQALARHPDGVLSFERMDELLERGFPNGITVMGDRTIQNAHLEAFFRPLIRNVFGGADFGPEGRQAGGLGRPSLARIKRAFEHWNDGQRYLEALYHAAGQEMAHSEPPSYLPATLAPFTLERLLELGEPLAPEPMAAALTGAPPAALMDDAARRLGIMIATDRALFPGNSDQIYFNGYGTPRGLSLHNMSEANWARELARLMTAGYALDPARADTDDDTTQALTFREFKQFVMDINDVGVDVKYIDPKDPKLAEKRFREAELFNYAGTGSRLINSRQASQLLALMISGKRLADKIHYESVDAGCPVLGTDPFEYPLVDAACFRHNFFSRIGHYWRNMPRLAAYYQSLDDDERPVFERALEDGARKQGYSDQPMNSNDSEGFGMIGQYVEVVFARFDKDDTGIIDWNEAEEAFPIFESALHEVACQPGSHCLDKDEDLKAVFRFLLAHGRQPKPLEFIRWRYLPIPHGAVAATRGTLMKIFGMLGKPASAGH